MFKSKDFYLKNIYDNKGKNLGLIDDIYIDFYNSKMVGFKSSKSGFFSKKDYIDIKDVIDIGEDIIVYEMKKGSGLRFREIKNMKVFDMKGEFKGVVEDMVIEPYTYAIKGIVVSSGLIDRLTKGKEILLLDKCILGDKDILYTGTSSILFKTMPHKLEDKYENEKN